MKLYKVADLTRDVDNRLRSPSVLIIFNCTTGETEMRPKAKEYVAAKSKSGPAATENDRAEVRASELRQRQSVSKQPGIVAAVLQAMGYSKAEIARLDRGGARLGASPVRKQEP